MANNDWIDRLFRYEQLEEFADFLRSEVDAKVTMPRANVSEARKGLALSPETEALVRDFARDDFTLYETLKPPKTLED